MRHFPGRDLARTLASARFGGDDRRPVSIDDGGELLSMVEQRPVLDDGMNVLWV